MILSFFSHCALDLTREDKYKDGSQTSQNLNDLTDIWYQNSQDQARDEPNHTDKNPPPVFALRWSWPNVLKYANERLSKKRINELTNVEKRKNGYTFRKKQESDT